MKHEEATARFYGIGVENYGTFHGNYLNFGLWENGITDYVEAAENLVKRVAEKINLNGDSVLLNVACGMGPEALFLMRTFNCKKITAVDLTKKHIEIARSRNQHNNIEYLVGDACYLPFEKESFTSLIGLEGIANFNTREDFFKEAYRLLRKNSQIGLSDFVLIKEPKNNMERKMLQFAAWLWHVPYENIDTKESYRKKLERNGFSDVDIELVSDNVYPGYVNEQFRPEIRNELCKIRGHLVTRVGLFLDYLLEFLHKKGFLGYVLVGARKE